MRKPHVLTSVEKAVTPRKIIFFDSESRVETEIKKEEIEKLLDTDNREKLEKVHDPYLVCATYYTRRRTRGKDTESYKSRDFHGSHDFLYEFWQSVDDFAKFNERTYVFAHNAKYDCLVTRCIPSLVSIGYRVVSTSDSNPFILRLVKEQKSGRKDKKTGEPIIERKTILILSSTNIYQTSLKKLGDTFGLPKLDFDHGQPFTFDDALIYCRRDVEILAKAMMEYIAFIAREELGNFQSTIAGQCFNAYRHRFMHHEILIHSHPKALEVERRAYAGGRNECYTIGQVDSYIIGVDVNSMYPSVMITERYPTKLVTFRQRMTLHEVETFIENGYLLCADCLVDTDIPIFHKKAERLIFPIGKFWTSLSTPEIVEGFKRGIIKRIVNVCVYEGAHIFADYVRYFYDARLQAKAKKDSVHDMLFKLFMNALYGKFGQKNIVWEKIADADPTKVSTMYVQDAEHGRYLVKTFGGGVWVQNQDEDEEEAFNSFPAIAAHVTAHARMRLWAYIEAAGIQNVHYMDTDSLFVTMEGFRKLEAAGIIDSKRLGSLKKEKEGRMVLYGCKDYEFNDYSNPKQLDAEHLIKIKGVSANSVEVEPDADGHKRFVSTVWHGFSEYLRQGSLYKYANRLQLKVLKREYTKGNIVNGRVEPFKLNEV